MAWRRPQSHCGQVRRKMDMSRELASRCPNQGASARYARRALLRAAVFETRDRELLGAPARRRRVRGHRGDRGGAGGRHRGRRPDGTEFFALSPSTVTWLGARTSPSALRAGDPVIIRHRDRADAATRRRAAASPSASGPGSAGSRARSSRRTDGSSWSTRGSTAGAPQRVVIAAARRAPGPGALPQAGTRLPARRHRHPARRRHLLAVAPATAQPPYRAGHPPAAAPGRRPLPAPDQRNGGLARARRRAAPACSGSATPRSTRRPTAPQPGRRRHGVRPAAVPVARQRRARQQRVRRPRGRAAGHELTAPWRRQFCDRCVECGTSPKGRVADLTMAAFVELGGNLEDGCFNATLTLTD